MIPYRILAHGTGVVAISISLLHGIILFGGLFYLPIYFEAVIGDRPLCGAVAALALALIVASSGIVCSIMIDHFRKYC